MICKKCGDSIRLKDDFCSCGSGQCEKCCDCNGYTLLDSQKPKAAIPEE